MNTPAYLKFYGKDLFIFTATLKKSEKAAILEGIIHLNMYGFWPENIQKLCEKSENFSKNFQKIEELFAKSLENYTKICERNLKNAKQKPLKNKQKQNPVATQSLNKKKETETEAEEETETEKTKLLTAAPDQPKAADPGGTFRAEPKTKLQKLGCWWVHKYYPELYATAGPKATAAWFKRYGRALSEVLSLADGDVPLAVCGILATEEQMAEFQKRKGEDVLWGLEAVSRNFTENYNRAQEILQSGKLPPEVLKYA